MWNIRPRAGNGALLGTQINSDMPTKIFRDGEDMVVLTTTDPTACYVRQGSTAAPQGPYVFDPSNVPVDPMVDECESDGDQSVELDTAEESIRDFNNTDYFKVVGGRPRTRKRK